MAEKKTKAPAVKPRKPRARRRHNVLPPVQLHRGKESGVPTLSENHYSFCAAFARTNSAEGAAAYAGFHPKVGWRLLYDKEIQAEIVKCKARLAEEAYVQASKDFEIERSYVSAKTVHFLETFETHESRGDADRVKVLEVAAKITGQIQPTRIINQASAHSAALMVSGATVKERYKSLWLIQKEQDLARQLAAENESDSANT